MEILISFSQSNMVLDVVIGTEQPILSLCFILEEKKKRHYEKQPTVILIYSFSLPKLLPGISHNQP